MAQSYIATCPRLIMRAYVVLLALLLVPLMAGHADATTQNVSTCSVLNTAGNTYTLNTSITNNSSLICMDITANNIVLDCQGYTVDGNDTVNAYGMAVS